MANEQLIVVVVITVLGLAFLLKWKRERETRQIRPKIDIEPTTEEILTRIDIPDEPHKKDIDLTKLSQNTLNVLHKLDVSLDKELKVTSSDFRKQLKIITEKEKEIHVLMLGLYKNYKEYQRKKQAILLSLQGLGELE